MKYELLSLSIKGDERGSLVAFEVNHNVPFDVKRVYCIFATDPAATRGQHAHKNLKQLLYCPIGSCLVTLDDGKKRVDLLLDSPTKGLYIEGVVWREMSHYSEHCVMVVLADDYYNADEYIRDYNEFREMVAACV